MLKGIVRDYFVLQFIKLISFPPWRSTTINRFNMFNKIRKSSGVTYGPVLIFFTLLPMFYPVFVSLKFWLINLEFTRIKL